MSNRFLRVGGGCRARSVDEETSSWENDEDERKVTRACLLGVMMVMVCWTGLNWKITRKMPHAVWSPSELIGRTDAHISVIAAICTTRQLKRQIYEQ